MLSTDQLAGITGCSVVDRDGTTCGTAGTVYVDDRTDRVAWVTVMLPMREEEMLAPADRAELRDGVLHLHCSLDELSRAPSMHGFESLGRADEGRLLEHYGMVGSMTDSPGAMAQSPTTGPGASGDLPTTMPSSSPVVGTGPHDAAPATEMDEALMTGRTDSVNAGRTGSWSDTPAGGSDSMAGGSSPVAGTGSSSMTGTGGTTMSGLGDSTMAGRERMGADAHHGTFDTDPDDAEEPHLRRYQAPLG